LSRDKYCVFFIVGTESLNVMGQLNCYKTNIYPVNKNKLNVLALVSLSVVVSVVIDYFGFYVLFQYLIKVNEIKTKKGIELLQHLVEYYHAQTK
jgi:hypothetical protein